MNVPAPDPTPPPGGGTSFTLSNGAQITLPAHDEFYRQITVRNRGLIGDADQTRGAVVDDLGVPAVYRRARLWLVLAVHEVTATTPITRSVVSAEVAEADAISDVPGADPVPDGVDDTDDLVAGHNRLAWVGTHALNTEYVAVANTAALNFDPDMTGTGATSSRSTNSNCRCPVTWNAR